MAEITKERVLEGKVLYKLETYKKNQANSLVAVTSSEASNVDDLSGSFLRVPFFKSSST